MTKIYVASSWRCDYQPTVVHRLRNEGYDVYDFKNPAPGDRGFHWTEVDPNWKSWTVPQFVEGLKNPIAERGFRQDMNALMGCDICVLVLPCGRSAHLEAGWAAGAGKGTFVYNPPSVKMEPELMYKMCEGVYDVLGELCQEIARFVKTGKITISAC